ncbi:hypothetical protein BCh11DRAFT_03714 [Burkholderia sp. Ch1-1]|nr:hypothetical protein BCh11DRAFT_03714 [Burkholderia sp. Ch1-1]
MNYRDGARSAAGRMAVSTEVLQRAVPLLLFTSGYAAGAAPTEAMRVQLRRRT